MKPSCRTASWTQPTTELRQLQVRKQKGSGAVLLPPQRCLCLSCTTTPLAASLDCHCPAGGIKWRMANPPGAGAGATLKGLGYAGSIGE